ncbi:hypothetical protein [Streptomyces sp. NPDC048172]|uniref:hypothetical protein n=1 Tax=Streptomyces sp. NPDC048172 TaxID=3365505 RepID=UPI00371DD2B7
MNEEKSPAGDGTSSGDVKNDLSDANGEQIVQAGSIGTLHIQGVLASRRVRWLLAAAAALAVAGVLLVALSVHTDGTSASSGGGEDDGKGGDRRAQVAAHAGSERPGQGEPGTSPRASATPLPPPPRERDAEPHAESGPAGDAVREPGADAGADSGSGSERRGRSDEAEEKAEKKAPFAHYETTSDLGPEIVGGARCGPYSLCGYRRAGHQGRHDFRAPEGTSGDTCYSFPSGDPGFVSVVNGRHYNYWVYEEPRCKGERYLITGYTGYQDRAFTSYSKT